MRDPSRNVYIPQMSLDPIFERQFERYWEYAQRRTGFTELFQGREQDRGSTLGEAELRTNKTEIRFKTIYNRFEEGWKELMFLTYYYDKKYMPKDIKIKVLGSADYQSLAELFPDGLSGKYDFSFSSEPLTDKARREADIERFYDKAMQNPLVANDEANSWGLLKLLSENMNIRNLEVYVKKPKSANALSAEESLQRILSGQYDLAPDPMIDANDYMIKIQAYMKTESYNNSDMKIKQAIITLLRRSAIMDRYQKQAMLDAMILEQGAQAEAMMSQIPQGGQSVPETGQAQVS